MSNALLAQIKRGQAEDTHRLTLSGPEGIGKSTFASKAPNPLFIVPEDGLTGLDHVQRFSPSGLDQLHGLVDTLTIDASGFQTLVVDTADWLERFLAQWVCKRDDKRDIEDYGYGKGYVVLENELVKFLQKLDVLRTKQKMWIIILSHVQIKLHTPPGGEPFDRYEMKGHKRLTGILREWPDANLFAIRDVFKSKDKATRSEKVVAGDRVIKTEWSPAWDAKNRLNLPTELPLDWDAFEAAVKENSIPNLCAKVRALHGTAKLPDDQKERWSKAVTKLETMTADKLRAAIAALTSMQ